MKTDFKPIPKDRFKRIKNFNKWMLEKVKNKYYHEHDLMLDAYKRIE